MRQTGVKDPSYSPPQQHLQYYPMTEKYTAYAASPSVVNPFDETVSDANEPALESSA